ncbi:PH domain-containing protein [Brevibacillus choshinensis]|uniref:PH domain-containing protein n=1 Tax=Brevibacillus choshinensis TaxID=54911 RepID=UPI002E203D07|nr:PH domain-containing protein [Brevibacillus choshinensis]
MAKIDKLIQEASTHLDPDEKIIASVLGAYETKVMGTDTVRNGVFLATDRRVFFFGKKMFGFDSESFPYSTISSFEYGKGLMGKTMSFFASGNKVKMKWINAGEVDLFMETVRSSMGKKIISEAPTQQIDSIEQIKKLAELRDAGILTEEEFTAKKHKILGI